MNDPNWLLSTTAQSAAALVAIVGGFLVSRVVALASERNSLEQRQGELKSRLRLTKGELEVAHEERLAVSKDWFEEHHLTSYVDARGGDDAFRAESLKWIPRGSNDDEMGEFAIELQSRVKRVFGEIESTYAGVAFPPPDEDSLRRDGLEFDETDDKLYRLAAAATATERRRGLGRRDALSDVTPFVSPPLGVDRDVERQDARILREQSLRADVRALKSEVSIIEKARARVTGAPEDLWKAVAVLAYFALVGTVLPLALMSCDPVPHEAWVRAMVVAGFFSGLAALLGYIGVTIRRFR